MTKTRARRNKASAKKKVTPVKINSEVQLEVENPNHDEKLSNDEVPETKTGQFPLNSDVIKRIRLNIGSNLKSSVSNQTSEEQSGNLNANLNGVNASHSDSDSSGGKLDTSIDNELAAETPLQNAMKKKLANVLENLHNDNIDNFANNCVNPTTNAVSQEDSNKQCTSKNKTESQSLSTLNEMWSSLDSTYQELVKTKKRNGKSNMVSLNNDLFNQFDAKLLELRALFETICNPNQNTIKRKESENVAKQTKKQKASA